MKPTYEHCKQREAHESTIYKKKTAKQALKWKKSCGIKYTASTKKKIVWWG